MGVKIRDIKLIIAAEPKVFNFDLPEDIHISFNHETDPIIKHN